MLYKTRPGLVLVRICGVDILTATREIWDQCPVVRPLPMLWSLAWFMMSKGRNSRQTIESLAEALGKTEEEAARQFEPIFEKLYQEGYLIPAEDEP